MKQNIKLPRLYKNILFKTIKVVQLIFHYFIRYKRQEFMVVQLYRKS